MNQSKQKDIFQPPQSQTTLTGMIERITYQNESNDFVVAQLRLESGSNTVSIVGKMPNVFEGERTQVEGEWRKHKRFGYQFEVKKITSILPVTTQGIRLYLGSGLIRGIGSVYADKIVDAFGLETLNILDSQPERLRELEGIGKKRTEMIVEAWQSQKRIKEIMMFLAEHGISSTYAIKIYKEYGTNTISVLKKNPYQLADDIYGIGFLTADKIAKNLGVANDEEARLEAGIKYTLAQALEQGHLFLQQSELIKSAAELLKVAADQVEQVCNALFQASHLVDEDEAVYFPAFYRAETELAQRIWQLISAPRQDFNLNKIADDLKKIIQLQGIEYNYKQKLALAKAIQEKVLILTGGPGTGKTTVIKGMIRLFEFLGLKVKLAAPTGRAAKRLTETSNRKALTIHRLLEYDPKSHSFIRNQKSPVKADVLIIDEVSMIDCMLAFQFIKAVPAYARLILVGDVNQLPSVGAGNVLQDLIDSSVVPTVELDEIFRQARDSQIVMNAHKINQGIMPELQRRKKEQQPIRKPLIPREDYGDFLFIQEDEPEKIVTLICELVKTKLPQRYGYNPLQDIQVLTPMYRGILGGDNLNQVLQNTLNPGKKAFKRGQTEFRVRDRVMQIRNNYNKMVYNGDLGFIQQIDTEEQSFLVSFEKMISYDYSEIDELVLAYAITVHKSQGSEYPVVIMPIVTQHYLMLQRNLLYTAATRAKELLVLIGTKKALAMAVKNNRQMQRNTRLKQRLMTTMNRSSSFNEPK